jgi:protein TonB
VFERLIESRRERVPKRSLGMGLVSLVLHGAVVAVAVIATLRVGRAPAAVKVDTTMVFLAQPRRQLEPQKPPPPAAPGLALPLKGFQTVVAPAEIPSTIPPVNLQERFNPKDYSGIGVEGGVAGGVEPAGEVYVEAVVEEKPELLAAPELRYPELLRQAGIQGRVVVQAVIDTTGRAEPSSIKIVRSPNPGFDEPARNWVLRAVFRPGRVHGRAVRVLVEIPIVFRLTGTAAREGGAGRAADVRRGPALRSAGDPRARSTVTGELALRREVRC